MKSYPEWKLGLIDSAWFGSPYEGQSGRQEAKTIGFDSLDLFIGFDPGRMTPAERRNYVTDVRGVDLPIISLVCTCLGLSDFNPAVRSYHIERAKNVLDLASEFSSARNLCFVPGEYMFQHHLRAGGERVEARGRRHAAGRTTCCRTAPRACDRTASVRVCLHPNAGRHGAFPGRRRPRERQGYSGHLAFLAHANSAQPRSLGSRAGSLRFTSPIATGSIMATSLPGEAIRRSESTFPPFGTLVLPAPRRSSSNFRQTPIRCATGWRKPTARPCGK